MHSPAPEATLNLDASSSLEFGRVLVSQEPPEAGAVGPPDFTQPRTRTRSRERELLHQPLEGRDQHVAPRFPDVPAAAYREAGGWAQGEAGSAAEQPSIR
jgi:hypothetical protein